jgi:hypothetical protein
MAGYSSLDLYRQYNGLIINKLDATLTQSCNLNFGNAFIENLKIGGDGKSNINLSTEMLNHLMKK